MSYGPTFRSEFAEMQADVYRNSRDHGFHDGEEMPLVAPETIAAKLALIHSELSEALEAVRDGNPSNDKGLPSRHWYKPEEGGPSEAVPLSEAAVELADVVIRCMDLAEAAGWDLATAIVEKHAYNKTRPHRHGGKAL